MLWRLWNKSIWQNLGICRWVHYVLTYFTVLVEADTEDEARELAHANINSFEVEDEYVSEWNIESVEEV